VNIATNRVLLMFPARRDSEFRGSRSHADSIVAKVKEMVGHNLMQMTYCETVNLIVCRGKIFDRITG
jgi:hypothetical protein